MVLFFFLFGGDIRQEAVPDDGLIGLARWTGIAGDPFDSTIRELDSVFVKPGFHFFGGGVDGIKEGLKIFGMDHVEDLAGVIGDFARFEGEDIAEAIADVGAAHGAIGEDAEFVDDAGEAFGDIVENVENGLLLFFGMFAIGDIANATENTSRDMGRIPVDDAGAEEEPAISRVMSFEAKFVLDIGGRMVPMFQASRSEARQIIRVDECMERIERWSERLGFA